MPRVPIKVLSFVYIFLTMVHVLAVPRLLALLYLVGPRFLFDGMQSFIRPLTNISVAVAFVSSILRIQRVSLVELLLTHGTRVLIVNSLLSSQSTNPYLYTLLVLAYSGQGAIENFGYWKSLNRGRVASFIRAVDAIVAFPAVSVVELLLLFHGLRVFDSFWFKAIIVAYVPTRFYLGKEQIKSLF
jgi:hypothetical protein